MNRIAVAVVVSLLAGFAVGAWVAGDDAERRAGNAVFVCLENSVKTIVVLEECVPTSTVG